MSAPTYSYWRLWPEGDQVRVARDWYASPPPGPQRQPQHLAIADNGYLEWQPHDQGAEIPAIPMSAFVAWLDQGGAA